MLHTWNWCNIASQQYLEKSKKFWKTYYFKKKNPQNIMSTKNSKKKKKEKEKCITKNVCLANKWLVQKLWMFIQTLWVFIIL